MRSMFLVGEYRLYRERVFSLSNYDFRNSFLLYSGKGLNMLKDVIVCITSDDPIEALVYKADLDKNFIVEGLTLGDFCDYIRKDRHIVVDEISLLR